MFKNISRKIAHTALVASFSILAATSAQAVGVPETSPEVGHVSWTWWANTSAPQKCADTSVTCDQNAPEIGHLGWIWWDTEKQPAIADAQGEAKVEINPELGHVSWLWWKEETTI